MKEAEQDYPVHTFFWYFESQNEPEKSPVSIWLNGGPGAGSTFGLFVENGPCFVNNDSSSTSPNEYSWNKNVNMLYIDQPAQAGFSYDVLTNATLNLKDGKITPDKPGQQEEIETDNPVLVRGTFGSQDSTQTANTTVNAARQFWNFVQVWTQEFKPYVSKKKDDNPEYSKLSIWTESYGGRYGPGFAAYFQKQNERIKKGAVRGEHINLDTLGVINGCIDLLSQETGNIGLAYDKNTYGFHPVDQTQHDEMVEAYEKKGGCLDQILNCHALAEKYDDQAYGNSSKVNEACKLPNDYCQIAVDGYFVDQAKWAYYDFTHCYLDPFPSNSYMGYLARAEVQQALGVRVNYTDVSSAVGLAFNLTGDYARGDVDGYLNDIGNLLDGGVKVALTFGDRDFACNWVGGENVSVSIDYKGSDKFRQAGYARIKTDDPEPNGDVRQYGNFSFSRVFQSGHMIPAYRPLLAYEIFHRTMFNRDVETGNKRVTDGYSTSGEPNSTHTESVLPTPSPTCYLRAMGGTCANNQKIAVENNNAIIVDYVVVSPPQEPGTCPTGTGSSALQQRFNR